MLNIRIYRDKYNLTHYIIVSIRLYIVFSLIFRSSLALGLGIEICRQFSILNFKTKSRNIKKNNNLTKKYTKKD
jgi:hypothetical protein